MLKPLRFEQKCPFLIIYIINVNIYSKMLFIMFTDRFLGSVIITPTATTSPLPNVQILNPPSPSQSKTWDTSSHFSSSQTEWYQPLLLSSLFDFI